MTAILDQDFDYTPAPTPTPTATSDGIADLDTLLAALHASLQATRGVPVAATLPKAYHAAAATYAVARATGAAPYRLSDVITAVAANPKRPGTAGHLRYSLWQTGMTVAAYLAALEAHPDRKSCRGFGPTDMTYNLKRGLITVAAPQA